MVCSSSRALFADLLRRATDQRRAELSPVAATYLVELLEARVRVPEPDAGAGREATLGEALMTAHLEEGQARLTRLRAVGDHSLFVAGFFGDSLRRHGPDEAYYRQIGRCAYDSLSRCLAARNSDHAWPALFRELSQRFSSIVELLESVSDDARPERDVDLVRFYEQYLETGNDRDRRRLLRRGVLAAPTATREWPQ